VSANAKNKQKPLELADPTDVESLQQLFIALKKPMQPSKLKQYGQNFLINSGARDAIIKAAKLEPTDTVLEIGPGSGVLTQKLVERAKRVVAIDIDPYLLEVTRAAATQNGQTAKNLELRLEDVRKINLPGLFGATDGKPAEHYVLVSNVPYYLTGYLLELFTSTSVPPKRMVLTLQKEVAERITARPDDQTILSIAIKLFGTARIECDVLRDAFWPAPAVDSAVLVIERHVKPVIPASETKNLMRVVKAGFSARRKKLANALSGGLHLELDTVRERLTAAGFGVNARAQELSLKDWAKVSQSFPA